jgi:hypothetical protein
MPEGEFDLNQIIEARLAENTCDPGLMGETPLQAMAVLIDADLTDSEREQAVAQLLAERLARLTGEEMSIFIRVAAEDGEAAAVAFLAAITRSR